MTPPISTNGHQPAENGRPVTKKGLFAGQSTLFLTFGTAIRPLYLLMGHRLGKSLRLPQNIFGAGRQLRVEARSGRFTI